MNLEIYKLFPTIVTKVESVFPEDKVVDLYNYIKKLDADSHDVLDGDAKSSHYSNSDCISGIVKNTLPDFKDMVEYYLNLYSDVMGIQKVEIANSWFNIQNKNSLLKYHTHPGSVVSLAFYVNVPNGSTGIVFDNPNSISKFNNMIVQSNPHNHGWYRLDVKAGDLVMFPSWLQHGSNYEKNQSNNRTVISINTKYK